MSAPSGVDWNALGDRLRGITAVDGTTRRRPGFRPGRPARVVVTTAGSDRSIVKVTAPDGIGLLEGIARWLSDHGVSIEAARVATRAGTAADTFLVRGAVDGDALAAAIGPARARRRPGLLGSFAP